MKHVLFFIVFFCGFNLNAEIIELKSGDTKKELIELYTSESCSSCPPAERWINQLKDQEGLWKTYIPTEFHVDYWNHLHWVDKYSKKSFSQRQRNYHRKLQAGVYTPQVIQSGENQRQWYRKNLSDKVKKQTAEGLITSSVNLDTGKVEIEFELKNKNSNELSCHIALMAGEIKTKVKRGENSGRNLSHEFVVIEFSEDHLVKNKSKHQCRLDIDLVEYNKHKSRSVAVWVSETNSGRVIQSAGAWVKK